MRTDRPLRSVGGGGGEDVSGKRELSESGYMICKISEDEPELGHYWEGAGDGDKDVTTFAPGEPLTLNPNHFPVGTRISQLEPDDPEFYAELFRRQNAARVSAVSSGEREKKTGADSAQETTQ